MKNREKMVTRYAYFVEYNQEDNIFIAKCAEFPDLAAHGKTQENALAEIKAVVLESLKWIQEEKGANSRTLFFASV